MQDGDLRVKQAAMEAGFGSYAQFRRVRNGLSGIRSRRD
jgi:hypothetical protein